MVAAEIWALETIARWSIIYIKKTKKGKRIEHNEISKYEYNTHKLKMTECRFVITVYRKAKTTKTPYKI